jgi:hypothetical protein
VTFTTWLALLIGGGVIIRAALAFGTKGLVFDLQSALLTYRALREHALHVYALVNTPALDRWPYPSGFFPLLLVTGAISHAGLSFSVLVRFPAILADAVLAWVVQDFLRYRGASERLRLGAAAAVALGPLFIASSGYDGQIDSLGILPAVVALSVWDRVRPQARAAVAGALIGVGGALKTVPLLMVLALLPSCRSRREAATLVLCAIAVPALAMAPFLIADAHHALKALQYHSLAGTGGLSLLFQPDLARIWLGGPVPHLTGLSHALQGKLGIIIDAIGLGGALAIIFRFKVRSVDAAALIWLTLFAVSANFGPRYAIWALPFFLMGGHIWQAVAVQAVLIVPTVLLRAAPLTAPGALYTYVALMLLFWAGCLAAAVLLSRRFFARESAGGRPIVRTL